MGCSPAATGNLRWRRRATGAKARFAKLPSEYIEERFSFTYITDQFAIANRHRIGVDRLLWSSDFPHGGSDWPNSWRTIDANFADVPRAERDAILAGNQKLAGRGNVVGQAVMHLGNRSG